MKGNRAASGITAALALAAAVCGGASSCGRSEGHGPAAAEERGAAAPPPGQPAVEQKVPAPAVENRYFILKPGHELVLEAPGRKSVFTVLDEVMPVGDTPAWIVQERDEREGVLAAVSRHYFSVSEKTGDVLYLGRDLQHLKAGKIVGTAGSWRSGMEGAKSGTMMPGAPSAGMKYSLQEAPGQAMDRVEIVSTDETVTTPAGTFTECVKTEETSELDPEKKVVRAYAPGIGLVRDGELLLTRHRFVNR